MVFDNKVKFLFLFGFLSLFLIGFGFAKITCVASDTGTNPIIVQHDQHIVADSETQTFYSEFGMPGFYIKGWKNNNDTYQVLLENESSTAPICKSIPLAKYAKVINSGKVKYYKFNTAPIIPIQQTTCKLGMTDIKPCQIAFNNEDAWDNFNDTTATYIIPDTWCNTYTYCSGDETGGSCDDYKSCGGTITLELETVSAWGSIANDFSVDVYYRSNIFSESTTTSNQINFDKTADAIFMPIRGKTLISGYWTSSKEDTKIGTLTISPNLDWWDDKGITTPQNTFIPDESNQKKFVCKPKKKDFKTCSDPTTLPINDYFKTYGPGTYYCSNIKAWYKVDKTNMVRCTRFDAKPATGGSQGGAQGNQPSTTGGSNGAGAASPGATNTGAGTIVTKTEPKKELPNCFWGGFFVNFYNGTKMYNNTLKLGECTNDTYTTPKVSCPPKWLGDYKGANNSIAFQLNNWDDFNKNKLTISDLGTYLKLEKKNYSYVADCINDKYTSLLQEYMGFTNGGDITSFINDNKKDLVITDLWKTTTGTTLGTGICSGFDIKSTVGGDNWIYKCTPGSKIATGCCLVDNCDKFTKGQTNPFTVTDAIVSVHSELKICLDSTAATATPGTLKNCDYDTTITSAELTSVTTSNKQYNVKSTGNAPNYTLTKSSGNITITDVAGGACTTTFEKGKYLYYNFAAGDRYFVLDDGFYNVYKKK